MAVTTTIGNAVVAPSAGRRMKRVGVAAPDGVWALAFATPYVTVFLAFVLYPVGYGLWLGSDPATPAAVRGSGVPLGGSIR